MSGDAASGEWALSLHAALPGDTSVEAAHTQAERAELRLRAAFPMLIRVTIHTEPYEEA